VLKRGSKMCGLILRGKVIKITDNSFDILVPEDFDLDSYVQRIVNNIDSALCVYDHELGNRYICFVNGFSLYIGKEEHEESATTKASASIEDLHNIASLADRATEANYIGVGSA